MSSLKFDQVRVASADEVRTARIRTMLMAPGIFVAVVCWSSVLFAFSLPIFMVVWERYSLAHVGFTPAFIWAFLQVLGLCFVCSAVVAASGWFGGWVFKKVDAQAQPLLDVDGDDARAILRLAAAHPEIEAYLRSVALKRDLLKGDLQVMEIMEKALRIEALQGVSDEEDARARLYEVRTQP